MKAVLILLALVSIAAAKDKTDPRLKNIHSLFVAGNNQAAEQARNTIQKDADKQEHCFVLSTNPKDADAVLDFASDANSKASGSAGAFGGRDWIVSANLILKSGDLIWSHSERWTDAPFMSGGKTAGKLLYMRLRKDACGK